MWRFKCVHVLKGILKWTATSNHIMHVIRGHGIQSLQGDFVWPVSCKCLSRRKDATCHTMKQCDRKCCREAQTFSEDACTHLAFCLSFARVVAVRCCSVKPCTFLCSILVRLGWQVRMTREPTMQPDNRAVTKQGTDADNRAGSSSGRIQLTQWKDGKMSRARPNKHGMTSTYHNSIAVICTAGAHLRNFYMVTVNQHGFKLKFMCKLCLNFLTESYKAMVKDCDGCIPRR